MNETFTIKELAIYLHSSTSGIRNLIRNKQLKCYYKLGNRYYFRKEAINQWIAEKEANNMQDKEYEIKIKPLQEEVS